MKFIDEAIITVQSGSGGSGCVSFRREKNISRGGPDGGDGGKGGDVILKTVPHKHTLYHFQFKRQFKAQDGKRGLGKTKTGRNADALIIEIPPGTLVSELDIGHVLKDFTKTLESFVVARGGRGGKGNKHFTTSTHRTPRFAQPGEPGQTITLKLELKLLADVGIVGLPNAGKSTLISTLSSARPKIDSYPFTTLTPNLGVVFTGFREPFVIADIPGLIEGAHKGTGLGIRFLKHIERTRVLIHLVDVTAIDINDPLRSYHIINHELSAYDLKLGDKPQLIVLNKLDLSGAKATAELFQKAATDENILMISAITGNGIEELKYKVAKLLDRYDACEPEEIL